MTGEEREAICGQFWTLSFDERRLWLRSLLQVKGKDRNRPRIGPVLQTSKTKFRTIEWQLPVRSRTHKVCKSFFMRTLGYNDHSDKAIRNAIEDDLESGSITPVPDRRGRNPCPTKCDEEVVIQHILSYKPAVPHYRRVHAPFRRYLPSDCSAARMHRECNESNPDREISHMTFRRILKDQNIGFTPLGQEECELCCEYLEHVKIVSHDETNCELCATYAEHKLNYTRAREEYRMDADREWDSAEVVVSADLMKVFVLPVLPFKECVFTSRLVAFNLTFALLNGKKKGDHNVNDAQRSISWHEETAGRNGDDIVSVYWKWLCLQRDRKKITIFADNCPAQNKQWKLFSCLLFAVNSQHIQATEIVLKFLEKGHTFMSADSWHHQCEQALRKR